MAERIFCAVIPALSFAGLAIQFRSGSAVERRQIFIYYTTLSNLLVALYHVALLIAGFFPEGAVYAALTGATVRFSVTLCIWVTHLIYHFVLWPGFKKAGAKSLRPSLAFSNRAIHYYAPLLTLLEWLLLASKDVTFASCVWWLVVPLGYMAFVMLRALDGVPIAASGGSLYPYEFIDLKKLGAKKFTLSVLMTTAGFFILSLALYGVSRLFA